MPDVPELNDRERLILYAVVNCYITTAEAVGSRTIVKRFDMDLSAATVRNVMSDLEEMGFLQQLHTSSGRVPTDQGYRFYVQHLMRVQELTLAEKARIEEQFAERVRDADDVLRQASHLLALVSHHAGLAESPGDETAEVQRMELLPIGERRLAVLIVDNFGRVRSMTVELPGALSAGELLRLTHFMNEHLHGLSTNRLAGAVQEKLKSFLDEQRLLAQQALEVLNLLPMRPRSQLFLEGASQLFEQPEFQTVEQARGVFNLLEEHDRIIDLLRSAAMQGNAERTTVLIGSDDVRGGLEGLGMVASPYRVNDRTVGMIGVLGPRRMNYSRLMSVVDYTADLVGRMLGKFGR